MTFRTTSISVLAALAVSAGGALAQSGDAAFCEQGVSRSDANGDGMISEQELAQTVDWEFSALDANGDGMISQQEYLDCRGAWNVSASTKRTLSEEDVSVLDRNDDGKVDQGEFMGQADQEYMARWSETGTAKEVRDADFAPATPENGSGVGTDETESASASEMQDVTATQNASGQQSAEAQKATGEGAPGSEGTLVLRRIVFVPQGKSISDMTRDEIAQRSALQFVLLDSDGNAVIEPQERPTPQMQQEAQSGDQPQAQEQSQSQEQAEISAEERQNIMRAILHQNFNQQFDRIDADRSGDVSREEYAADAERRWQQAQERARSRNMQNDAGAPVVLFHYPHPM